MTTRTSLVVRNWTRVVLACLSALIGASSLPAQQAKTVKLKLESIEVGFHPEFRDDNKGCFKTGMWAPVYVTLAPDEKGSLELPVRPDGQIWGTLLLTTNDTDDIETTYPTAFVINPAQKSTIISYLKPSSVAQEIKLALVVDKKRFSLPKRFVENQSLAFGDQLYVTLGRRIAKFQEGLIDLKEDARVLGYETQVGGLPDIWFGYEAVDFLVLSSDNQAFLEELVGPKSESKARVKALAQWVRQGGRLLITISPVNQDSVYRLLQSPHWAMSLEKYLSKDQQTEVLDMTGFRTSIGAQVVFPLDKLPIQVPKLHADKSAEVLLRERKTTPLMIQVPCGLGNVTLLALEPSDALFTRWEGSRDFWKYLVKSLAPTVRKTGNQQDNFQGMQFTGFAGNDVTSRLHREMEDFNVPMVSFGWVVLFIFIYILIVGPLDYFILKKVFKRLEWTWITFPTVVLVISVLAYFTAYAMKGDDLKINKIDLVEVDLRSNLDEENKTEKMSLYGTSWFSILSPRIQNYTIGLEPTPEVWDTGIKNPGTADVMMSWMGRPEFGGPENYGRQQSRSLFKKSYEYAPEAQGLEGVPIPVWTTKTFQSTWDVPGLAPKGSPLLADLYFKINDVNQTLQGTIQNNLPVELLDVSLIYGGNYYTLQDAQSLPTRGPGAKPIDVKANLKLVGGIDRWTQQGQQQDNFQTNYNTYGDGDFLPDFFLKSLYFHDKTESAASSSNYVLGRLDQSWRIQNVDFQKKDVRTAILVARLPRVEGSAENLTAENDPRLATHLWLGAIPGEGETRPPLSGTLNQITYLRVYIPVRPE